MRMIKGLALGLMLASLPVTAAEVYKWVDPAGGIHYGDRPQPGWKPVTVNAPPASAPGAQPVASAEKAADPEVCKKKRDELESYQKAARVVERDALGREKVYSDEDRKKLVEMAQKDADKLCAGK